MIFGSCVSDCLKAQYRPFYYFKGFWLPLSCIVAYLRGYGSLFYHLSAESTVLMPLFAVGSLKAFFISKIFRVFVFINHLV